MNNETFILAVLVNKEIVTVAEAKRLQKSLRESVTNSDLPQMLDKVNNALNVEDTNKVTKIDAKDLFKAD